MPSVLLVTDDSVLASGLTHILERTEDLRVVGACAYVESLPEVLRQIKPTIVLIDMTGNVSMPSIADIRKSAPDCHVCLWVRHLPDELAYQAMGQGVRGILRRALPVTDVVNCLRKLSRGEVWFEERLMGGFFSYRTVRLTKRESQLVGLLAQGLKNKEIAYAMSLSEGTVKVYLSRLFEKLAVRDRFELALYGLRNLTADQSALETRTVPDSSTGPVEFAGKQESIHTGATTGAFK
jgi:two-component system nitrate/nitrite response regulator NarL